MNNTGHFLSEGREIAGQRAGLQSDHDEGAGMGNGQAVALGEEDWYEKRSLKSSMISRGDTVFAIQQSEGISGLS